MLSKDLVTTTYNDAADPDLPSLRLSDGPDVTADCGDFLLRENTWLHVANAVLNDGGCASPGARSLSGSVNLCL